MFQNEIMKLKKECQCENPEALRIHHSLEKLLSAGGEIIESFLSLLFV